MPSIFVQLLIGLLALGATAHKAPLRLCTGSQCKNCPSSLTTTGTGYPKCVIYKRETVLAGSAGQFPPAKNGVRKIWYDIKKQDNPECRTIIRSPAGQDDDNCGAPIYGGKGGICLALNTFSTFMVQFCCGHGDCTAAGVGKRYAAASPGLSGSLTSAVLVDDKGAVVVPHAVGDKSGDHLDEFLKDHGLDTSSKVESRSAVGVPVYSIGYDVPAPAPVEKRACNKFIQNGDVFSKTGSKSFQVSARICGGAEFTKQNTQSVSRTTTFSASVGDPFGIVQVSVGFSTEKSYSQSSSYTFKPPANQCGHVAWTPFFLCVKGKITGCANGAQTGQVCKPKKIPATGDIDGTYTFVITG